MTEAEAKDFFGCIARAYKPNGKFKLKSFGTGDIELTNYLIVSFDEDYCTLAYMPENSLSFGRPQAIVIGKPFTFQNAYNVFMECASKRDVGLYWYFGDQSKWIPVFKKGLSYEKMRIELDLRKCNEES